MVKSSYKNIKEEVDKLLKDFYKHACGGLDDYGCHGCLVIRDKIVALSVPGAQKRHTITEVALRSGLSTKTIIRWEQAGRIQKARRDYRGWRIYDNKDITNIREVRENVRKMPL